MVLLLKALSILAITGIMIYNDVNIVVLCIIALMLVILSYIDYYLNNIKFRIAYLTIGLILVAINNYFIYLMIMFVIDAIIAVISNKIKAYKEKIVELEDNLYEIENKANIQNTQLLETQDNEIYYATLNERARISREIHDNVGHILSSSIIQLGAIKKISKDENIMPLIEQLDLSLHDGMDSIRDSVHNLHAKSFDLKNEIENVISKYLFCKVMLNYDLDEATQTKTKVAILSIIKEALNNTSKYSNADLVKITVREFDKHIQVIINDNGSTSGISNAGIGLLNMQDRVESLGGLINITNSKGFKIHITIPKGEKK